MPKKYKYKTSFTFEGKRYQIYADTQKELYKKEERKRLALENGRILVSSNMLLKDWYVMYVDSYKSNVKEITLKNWKCKMEKQLIAELGAMPLSAIKPLHLQRIAQIVPKSGLPYELPFLNYIKKRGCCPLFLEKKLFFFKICICFKFK